MKRVRLKIIVSAIAILGIMAPSAHADVAANATYLAANLCVGDNTIIFYNNNQVGPALIGATTSQASHISGEGQGSVVIDSFGTHSAPNSVAGCNATWGDFSGFPTSGLVTLALLDMFAVHYNQKVALVNLGVEVGVTRYTIFHTSTVAMNSPGLNYLSFAGGTTPDPLAFVPRIGAWTTSFDGNGATSGTAPSPIFTAQGGTGGFNLPGNIGRSTNSTSNAVLTKTGYTFLGWNTSPTATAPMTLTNSAFTPTGDTVLYAVWKANS